MLYYLFYHWYRYRLSKIKSLTRKPIFKISVSTRTSSRTKGGLSNIMEYKFSWLRKMVHTIWGFSLMPKLLFLKKNNNNRKKKCKIKTQTIPISMSTSTSRGLPSGSTVNSWLPTRAMHIWVLRLLSMTMKLTESRKLKAETTCLGIQDPNFLVWNKTFKL